MNANSNHFRLVIAVRALSRVPLALAGLLACTLTTGAAFANPTGPQIVSGQVTIVGSGNQLSITNSPGAIINWQSFSIGAGELTRFIQQSSSSSVLNRITGQNPSQIFGTLQSNGKVFLINPNGVLFGPGSQINVSGLVASSLNLSDTDFLAGKLDFSGTGSGRTGRPGDVGNQGAITTPSGGQVYLIAPNVANTGIINSPAGDVMLAAGQSVNLADSNDPDMRVVISAPGNQALNIGKVVADSGRIGIYGAFVNQLGLVSANSAVAGENGKIVFKSSGDTLLGAGSLTTATGSASGGEIQVLGSRVGLTGNALVDASGRTGGGTVLIGGDTHGADPAIQNATLTYMGPMARIMADAEQSGDGGKVVVWSDQQTQMYGDISARGGTQGGNGGFVEASSANLLDFRGLVDLRAPKGASGNLLLDPTDITIEAGTSSGDIDLPGSAPFTITGSNPTSVLSVADLQNELGLGNVTVSTSSSASAPLGGTITVASAVAWSNANSLTLAADQSITINAPITASAGTLVLTAANGNISQALNVSAPAAISVASLAATAPNGSVTLTEPTNNVSGAIAGTSLQGFSFTNAGAVIVGSVGTASGITSSGNITITSDNSVTVSSPIQVLGAVGNVGLRAANGIVLNNSITVPGANGVVALQASSGDIAQNDGSITAASVSAVALAGSVELTEQTNAIGTIAGSANGGLGFSLVNGSSFTVGTVPAVGNIPAAGGVTSLTGSGLGVVLQAPAAGDITLNAPVNGGSTTVLVDAAGAVVQGAGGLITAASLQMDAGSGTGIGSGTAPILADVGALANINSQGPVFINNSGNLTIDSINAIGAVTVNAGGSLTIPTAQTCDCSLSVTGSSVTLTASGAMLLSAASSITAGGGSTVTPGGPVALYAGYDAASGNYVASPNTLTLAGSVAGSGVNLFAGGAISVTGSVTGTLTQMASQYSSTSPPAPPTTPPPAIPPPVTPPAPPAAPPAAPPPATPPTVAQCAADPSATGCSGVVTTVVDSIPVVQATNTAIVAVNTSTSDVIGVAGASQSGGDGNSGGGSQSNTGNSSTTNTGAANNEPAKKMYCN